MDIRFDHGSDIHVVRANCDDAPDLVAIGGTHSVQVLLTVSHLSFERSRLCTVRTIARAELI